MSFLGKILAQKRAKTTQRESLASAQQLLKDKINVDGKTVVYEFERLRRTDAASFHSAERVENEGKNRYSNVLPFDANRVCLAGPAADYINASLVESREGEHPRWKYICTQGPLRSTVDDFWLMVYQQRSNVVVMLTRTLENGHVEKCAPYFPEKQNESHRYGTLTVTTLSQVELDNDITARELRLSCEEKRESRRITHYHYHAWPDHGVPTATQPLRRLSELLRSTKCEGAPVVHCSAGIGRTGTFCTIDIILRRLQQLDTKDTAAAERAVDVKRVVTNLRKQRVGMVQTPGQYLFCHQAVKEEIEEMLGVQDIPLSPAVAQSPME